MLSQTSFYKKYQEELAVSLAGGLVGGLAGGLVGGLAGGLAGGLVGGLAVGLAWGLAVGLAVSLVGGLAVGLAGGLAWGLAVILVNWKEALPFFISFPRLSFLIIGIIIISEIMFILMPKEKIKKGVNVFWFTTERKLENVFEVILTFSAVAQVYILVREGTKYYTEETTQFILEFLGYLGLGTAGIVLVIGILYIWIKLNSIKYANNPHSYKSLIITKPITKRKQ